MSTTLQTWNCYGLSFGIITWLLFLSTSVTLDLQVTPGAGQLTGGWEQVRPVWPGQGT